jgi:hypothetical protein
MKMRILALAVLAVLLAGCGNSTVTQTNRTARYNVQMALDSAAIGQRTITFAITDLSGAPADVEAVVTSPVMRSMGMASPEMTATRTGPGRYEVRGEPFSMQGQWEIDVRISAAGQDDTTTFLVAIQ